MKKLILLLSLTLTLSSCDFPTALGPLHEEEEIFFGDIPEETFVHTVGTDFYKPDFELDLDNLNDLNVHFLDVGQGDSIFIELPTNETMLIDAGDNDGELITDYIKDLGYSDIDYVVATHYHADHIGGMAYVLQEFDIGQIYLNNAPAETKTAKRMANLIENKNIASHIVDSSQLMFTEDLGNINLTADILAPVNDKLKRDSNNSSIIIKLTYGDTSFLFTGDAEEEEEATIINKDISADVLKLGHHGSSTSTGITFLQKVNPTYAVISCGVDNDYGHPHKETIEKMSEFNIDTYRTDENGTIVMTSNGYEIKIAA